MSVSQKHNRRSVRLKETNYADAGGYFITLATFGGAPRWGDHRRSGKFLYPFGKIVEEEWLRTPVIRPEIILEEYVIMPNHLHGIIFIAESQSRRAADTPPSSP